jgi:hypothetical protein
MLFVNVNDEGYADKITDKINGQGLSAIEAGLGYKESDALLFYVNTPPEAKR